MRRTLKTIGVILFGIAFADIGVGLIDWLARWDWLESIMVTHPRVADFLRTPVSALCFVVFAVFFVLADRWIKEPHLVARYVNSRLIPDLHTTPLKVMFETEKKKPGWDETQLDWDWFVEVQMANASETPCTVDGVEVKVRVGPKLTGYYFKTQYLEDLDDYDIDMGLDFQGNQHEQRYAGERYRPLTSLMNTIRNVPLRQEIGYRGWVHFKVFHANQRDIYSGQIRVDMWLIDAMQRKHELQFKKKDDRNWDRNFYIGLAVKAG